MQRANQLPSTIVVAAIAGASALLGSIAGPYINYFSRDREMDIKMVEIAVGILRADEKKEPGLVPARSWATDIIDKHAQVRLTPAARAALIEYGVKFVNYSDFGFDSGSADLVRRPSQKFR